MSKQKVSIAAKLSLAFLFLFSSLAGNQAWAVACSTSISPYAISCDATGVTWSTGALTINVGVTVSNEFTVSNTSSTFVNNGSLITNNGIDGLHIGGVTTFTNNGIISGSFAGIQGSATNFVNNGTVSGIFAFYNNGPISSFVNNSSISGSYVGITNSRNTISSLINTGTISGGSFGISNSGTISSLINTGTITGGVSNGEFFSSGVIGVLENSQGAASVLNLSRQLPTNYNIIINSTSDYGQIAFSSPSGTTTFGISSLSGTNIGVTGTRYQNVISGLSSTNITNIADTLVYQNGNLSATFKLVTDDLSVATTWDLLILSMISGPSATDTQASLNSLAPKLRGAFSGQAIATNFANMNTYDCSLFDAKGVCVSVGGQQTYVDNPSSNMTSTVAVAGYKVSPNIRIGGFLNQNINNNTVSGVHISNANPLMGVFAVWNQKEDRLGYQVKIANAYQDKDVTTTRDVIDSSEAGIGRTNLNTQSYVGELSYAFLANQEKTLVRPYTALRYTSIKQDGYTEQTSAGVTAPLTYAALADRSTTALVGVKLNHKLAEKVNLTGSFGIEQDLHHQVDNLTATGIPELTSENFNNSIKRTRPVASIGAYYMPVKNQRIAGELFYQQLPFQSTGSATAYFNYMIGF
jgi:hypothetical protein